MTWNLVESSVHHNSPLLLNLLVTNSSIGLGRALAFLLYPSLMADRPILAQNQSSIYSCYEFMITMALSYPEDDILQNFSLSSRSYMLSVPLSMFYDLERNGINVLFRTGKAFMAYSLGACVFMSVYTHHHILKREAVVCGLNINGRHFDAMPF